MSLYEKFLATPRTIPSTNVSMSLLASTVGMPAVGVSLDHPLIRELADADWNGDGDPQDRPKRVAGSVLLFSDFIGQDWTRLLKNTSYSTAGDFTHELHPDTRYVEVDSVGGGGGGGGGCTVVSGGVMSSGGGGGGGGNVIVNNVYDVVQGESISISVGRGGLGQNPVGSLPPSSGTQIRAESGGPTLVSATNININLSGGVGGMGGNANSWPGGAGGDSGTGGAGGGPIGGSGSGAHGSNGGGGGASATGLGGNGGALNSIDGGIGGLTAPSPGGSGGGGGSGGYNVGAGKGGNGHGFDNGGGQAGFDALGDGNGGGGGCAFRRSTPAYVAMKGGDGSDGVVVIREYRVNPANLKSVA
ncbi:conserved hypothetical protein [Vibrio chagasii]|nr:conserved hypothetical protein [Vibrio chagasii]